MSGALRIARGVLRRLRALLDRVDGRLRRELEPVPAETPEPETVVARPLDIAWRNVDLVREVLDEAGVVDWGLVRNQSHNRLRVAVLERDRARIARTLRERHGSTWLRAIRRDGPDATTTVDAADPAILDAAHIWRLFREYRVPGSSSLRYGALQGCDVEFWAVDDAGDLEAPSRNLVSQLVPADVASFEPARIRDRDLQVLEPLWSHARLEDQVAPIDVVYTWVDAFDPAWRRRYAEARAEVTGLHEEAANAARFEGVDHLRYSLRSLAMYAPWVRTIYLVTDDQVPAWLDPTVPGLRVVDHRELFGDDAELPTFNSHAIESVLHRIDGLSDTYLYFNDDVFLGRMTAPDLFVEPNGLLRIFPSVDHVDLGPVRADERPFMAASKVVRGLIHERTGRFVTQKMKHAPHVQSRALARELETTYADLVAATRRSRFRSPTDVSLAAALHPWTAFVAGKAVRADLAYAYVNTSEPGLVDTLDRLAARRDRDVFCLNDTTADQEEMAVINAAVQPFLDDYFPVPSPYERDAPGTGTA